MNPKWLLEKKCFEENYDKLTEEITKQGMIYKCAEYKPYKDSDYLDLFSQDDCVIFYGSINFANKIRKEASWIPGVYFHRYNYECTSYYPVLGEHLLNKNYIMLPFGDLLRQKDYLYNKLGINNALFLRPNSAIKPFTGMVIKREDYERELKYLGHMFSNDLCVVSQPRNIFKEWRFVVVENRVITGSQYISDDEIEPKLDFPEEALRLAEIIAKKYSPDLVWIVDICQTKFDFYVLEVNSFSSSGLYACDLAKVVKEVSEVALREYNEYA